MLSITFVSGFCEHFIQNVKLEKTCCTYFLYGIIKYIILTHNTPYKLIIINIMHTDRIMYSVIMCVYL